MLATVQGGLETITTESECFVYFLYVPTLYIPLLPCACLPMLLRRPESNLFLA